MQLVNLGQDQALPDFHFEERGGAKIWVDRHFADHRFIDQIADCDLLLAQPDCRIIKDQRKIRIGRLTLKIAGRAYNLYIKRFNAFSIRYQIGSLMSVSAALKSLEGAALLQTAGIRTARPVAAVERRVNGILTKSFFITEEINGAKTADAYWLEDLSTRQLKDQRQRRRLFLQCIAQLFQSLHAGHIYHNDLKDANILVVADVMKNSISLFLLDLEGVRRYSNLSARRRTKNLVQLNRTLGRYLQQSDKLFFLRQYLGPSFSNIKARRELIESVVRDSKLLDAKKLRQGR